MRKVGSDLCLLPATAVLAFAASPPLAFAQPVSTQGAVSAALGAPAQARVATPPPGASAKPGEGAGPMDSRQKALAAAIAANDVAGIVQNGGTASDVMAANFFADAYAPAKDSAPGVAMAVRFSTARFVTENGKLAVALAIDGSDPSIRSLGDLTLPGGNEGLPTAEDLFGPGLLPTLANPLPPGPPRALPEIPAEWLNKAP